MQNPFTTTFSKTPENTYIHTDQTDEILENFVYEHPLESVYKVTGVRGSGKTVLSSGGGLGYTKEKSNDFFDIGVAVETMIQAVQKKGKKILIGIDEVSKSEEMVKFASEYGRWLRAGYPVYFVCTGLYENIQELSNVKNLTFFRRAATVKTEPLNMIRMTEMDRFLVSLLTEKEEYKREEVLNLMGARSGNYSMYRDRLIKRGILNSRQGFISLALPYFAEYVKDYC